MKPEFADRLPENWERLSRFFSARGATPRQQILLVFEPGEEICVNHIARLFKISRPAISHHLKVLRNAELLVGEKRGKEVYYRINQAYCVEVITKQTKFVIRKKIRITTHWRTRPPERHFLRVACFREQVLEQGLSGIKSGGGSIRTLACDTMSHS